MGSIVRDFTGQDTVSIADLYTQVRARTMEIVAPLEIEDYVIQTADFMSPPRWHIGHTSWFFETVLRMVTSLVIGFIPKIFFSTSTLITKGLANASRGRNAAQNRGQTVKETVTYRNHIDEQVLVTAASTGETCMQTVAFPREVGPRARNATSGIACLRY